MIKTVFEWREDQEFGGYGWIPKGYPDFNIVRGDNFAHDCIEHFKPTLGGLSDEMMAFGAMLYIRVESGWFYQKRFGQGAVENMGSDIGVFLENHESDPESYRLVDPGVTRPLDDDMEAEIAAIMAKGVKNANENRNWEAEEGEKPQFALDYKTEWMTGWMRRGYRKTIKRFHGNSPCELSDLFDRIAAGVHASHTTGDEGEELHVAIDPRSLELKIDRRWKGYSFH